MFCGETGERAIMGVAWVLPGGRYVSYRRYVFGGGIVFYAQRVVEEAVPRARGCVTQADHSGVSGDEGIAAHERELSGLKVCGRGQLNGSLLGDDPV
jgi:hypothetical protein